MDNEEKFIEDISKGYTHKGDYITFGAGIYNEKIYSKRNITGQLTRGILGSLLKK